MPVKIEGVIVSEGYGYEGGEYPVYVYAELSSSLYDNWIFGEGKTRRGALSESIRNVKKVLKMLEKMYEKETA